MMVYCCLKYFEKCTTKVIIKLFLFNSCVLFSCTALTMPFLSCIFCYLQRLLVCLSCTWWSFYQCYITNFLMNVFVDKSIVRFIIYLYWITMNLLVVNHSRSRIIYFCESDANKSFHSLLDGIHYKGQTWYAYFECCFVFSFFVTLVWLSVG